jgi:Transposase, Mutator family
MVLSLYAKGLTTGEISAHFAEIYGASVSKETISRITGKVIEEMADWCGRPLDEIYAAVFVDAVMVKVSDGQVANRPIYAAIGVTLAGEKDILGLWAGSGGEGAKFWMSVLTELRNRGVKDVFFVVCDGLKGLPEVAGNVWPQAIVQTCIVHLIRNTFHLASKRDWDALRRDIKPICTAVNADAARAALDDLAEQWGQRYGAIIRLWENAWEQFIPFLDYDAEIRKVLCSTNAIESLNARYRRAGRSVALPAGRVSAGRCLSNGLVGAKRAYAGLWPSLFGVPLTGALGWWRLACGCRGFAGRAARRGRANVTGDGQRLSVTLAGPRSVRGPGRELAEAVERLGLAEPVADVAKQRQGLLLAGGRGRIVPGLLLHDAEAGTPQPLGAARGARWSTTLVPRPQARQPRQPTHTGRMRSPGRHERADRLHALACSANQASCCWSLPAIYAACAARPGEPPWPARRRARSPARNRW